MKTITRRLEFDAGHRVLGHQGKCRFLHGHRYVAEVSITAPELNSLGMVIDFSLIKQEVGGWIDENWDHNLLLNRNDPLLDMPLLYEMHGRPPYLFGSYTSQGRNPTAEVMAQHLYRVSTEKLKPHEMTVTNVRLYETPNCWADYAAD